MFEVLGFVVCLIGMGFLFKVCFDDMKEAIKESEREEII